MTGTITFTVSGGIARFSLENIVNIHTDGSGILKFNVIGAASEFDFTAADEAAAQRIANLITTLQGTNSNSDFLVGDNVNYPLPPIPAINNKYLYYDPLANNWFVKLNGTNMTSAANIIFNGVMRDIQSASATDLQSTTFETPPYGDLEVELIDSKGNSLSTTTISFHHTINTFIPNPFVGGTDSFVVNGMDLDNATLGVIWVEDIAGGQDFDGSHCPATFVSVSQLSFPSGSWVIGTTTTPPLGMVYVDSDGKWSNYLYVASIT